MMALLYPGNSSLAVTVDSTWTGNLSVTVPSTLEDNLTLSRQTVLRSMPEPPDGELLVEILSIIKLYFPPFLVLIGLCGNTASALVFLNTRLRKHSCSIYCAAIAISNVSFVVVLGWIWLLQINIPIYNQDGWCQFFTLVSCASSNLSSWYTLLLALDRYLAVRKPKLRKRFCHTICAKLITVLVGSFAVSVSVNMSLTVDVLQVGGVDMCIPIPSLMHKLSILSHIDVLFNAFLITLLTVIINSLVMTGLRRAYITRRRSISIRDLRPNTGSLSRLDLQLSRACCIAVTAYILCCLPSHVQRVYATILELALPRYRSNQQQFIIQNILQHVYYTAFVVNTFVFAMSLKVFRMSFRKMVQRLTSRFRRRKRPNPKGIYALASATVTTRNDTGRLKDLSLM